MKRFSVREMMFLCLPLLVVPASVLVAIQLNARRMAERRAEEPRVEACFLRAPSPQERWAGADVGLTIVTSNPLPPSSLAPRSQPLYDLQSGKRLWRSSERIWKTIVVESDASSVATDAKRQVFNLRAGLKWKQLAPKSDELNVITNFYPFAVPPIGASGAPIKAHTRKLKKPALPLVGAKTKNAGFSVTSAVLSFQCAAKGKGLQPILVLRVRCAALANPSGTAELVEPLVIDFGQKTPVFPTGTAVFSSHATRSDRVADGTGKMVFEGFGTLLSPSRASKIRGVISADRGWPLEITIDLPRGIKPTSGERMLKFETRLAPPKK